MSIRSPWKRVQSGRETIGGIQIVEEAFTLLRGAPWSLIALYYAGSLPFVLGLLYYWADMRSNPYAASHISANALGVTLLFFWTKGWQCVFMRGMWNQVSGSTDAHWTAGSLRRMFLRQCILQPTALVLLPLAALPLFPFAWTYGFYMSVAAMDDGADAAVLPLCRRAWAQARLWPMQSIAAQWLVSPALLILAAVFYLTFLPVMGQMIPVYGHVVFGLYAGLITLALLPICPFGIIISANIAAALIAIPQLMKMLLGIDTVFTRLGLSMLFSSTMMAVVAGLAYLCMDPIIRAVFVLRCFYGAALASGEDLRADLRFAKRQAGPLLMLLFTALCLFAPTAHAQAEIPSPAVGVNMAELDRALDETLSQSEYIWRAGRSQTDISLNLEKLAQKGPVVRFLEWSGKTIQSMLRWAGRFIRKAGELWRKIFPASSSESPSWGAWPAFVELLLWLLAALLAAAAAVFIYRMWRKNRLESMAVAGAGAVVPEPVNLEDEHIIATALPEEGWLALAREMMAKGELRLAMRALFLASIAALDARGLLTAAKYKSNRDYMVELERRAHAEPMAYKAFQAAVLAFECVWYGAWEATVESVARLEQVHAFVRPSHAAAQTVTENSR